MPPGICLSYALCSLQVDLLYEKGQSSVVRTKAVARLIWYSGLCAFYTMSVHRYRRCNFLEEMAFAGAHSTIRD